MIVTINAAIKCENGKAPSEADVDAMYSALESRRNFKGYKNELAERQYWQEMFGSDNFIFGIFKDYET